MRPTLISKWFVLVCLFSLPSGAFAQGKMNPRSATFPASQYVVPASVRTVLGNGLVAHIVSDPTATISSASVMIRGGALYDPQGKEGAAVLLAEGMRNGGTHRLTPDQVDDQLDTMATQLSISFSDETGAASVSALPEAFPTSVALLAELLFSPRLDAQRLTIARQQMLEAVKRFQDDPKELGSALLQQAAFRGHAAGRIQTKQSVASITELDLRKLHTLLIRPENIIVAISGPGSIEDYQAVLQPFASVQFAPLARTAPPPQEVRASTEAPRVYAVPRDINQTVLRLGRWGLQKDDPDLYGARVTDYILGGSFTSRLMMEIRTNRGLTYHVGSHFSVGRLMPGLLSIETETTTENASTVLALIHDICRGMMEKDVQTKELMHAKEAIIQSFAFSFSTPHAIASQRARVELLGYPKDYLERFRERIAGVTVEDVRRVSRRFLDPKSLNIVMVGKQLPREATLLPSAMVQITTQHLDEGQLPE